MARPLRLILSAPFLLHRFLNKLANDVRAVPLAVTFHPGGLGIAESHIDNGIFNPLVVLLGSSACHVEIVPQTLQFRPMINNRVQPHCLSRLDKQFLARARKRFFMINNSFIGSFESMINNSFRDKQLAILRVVLIVYHGVMSFTHARNKAKPPHLERAATRH